MFSVAETVKPHALATYFISAVTQDEIREYIGMLSEHFSSTYIMVSGMQASNIEFRVPDNVKLIPSAKVFKQFVTGI